MATVFPSPSPGVQAIVDQSPPQNLYPGAPRPRSYTPYVFQPNFLKQQLKQRMNEILPGLPPDSVGTGANSIPLGDRDKLSHFTSHTPSQINSANAQQANSSSTQNVPSFLDDIAGRKKMGRKVIDWTSSCALYLENRRFDREIIDVPDMLPDTAFTMEMQSVIAYKTNPVTSITSKFIRSATNKMKCPVYKVVWTPDGRRLVTGSASGEFTLWNGTAFNFETILQAHDCPVRAMAWSKHDNWLITGDNQGYIKYWQLNMNNVKMYQAHKDQACRSVSFGPTDHKFATASDDGTVRIWDFLRCHEERILRGHGADVKQIDWHPMKGIVASASKDLHTPVKLWDPKTGQSLATLHAHKGTVMDVKWNQNGNWVLSASRDHLIKLYDIRNLKQEMQVFRGHKKEAFSVAWHPIHEDLFASGGSEGSILFWQVGEEKEAGTLEGAHDSLIWSLAWHPLGHVLVSGSNDHSTKFWARSRPGDSMRDRYNLCLLPQVQEEPKVMPNIGGMGESSDNPTHTPVIPGMGDADVAAAEVAKRDEEEQKSGIPGLDWSYEEKNEFDRKMSSQYDRRKFAYARPVPRAFVAAWEANKEGAPPERPRSPRFLDRDRDFGRPRWRDRFDGPSYKRGRDFRNGAQDSGGEDDNKIFVDGVEVGPDFNPDEITGERVSPEREPDRRRRSPIRGRDRPPRGPDRRRDRSPPIGRHDRPPLDGPPDRPFRGEPDRFDRPPADMQDRPPFMDRPFLGGPDGRPGPDRPRGDLDRPPIGGPEGPFMGGPDRPPMDGPERPPMRNEADIPPLMSIDGPAMGGPNSGGRPGPPSPRMLRRPSSTDNRKLRDDLYDELLRSGSERDMELMRELEEHGLALEDGLADEPDMYFDENGDPIGDMGPNVRGRFGSQDEPPRFRGDRDNLGRGRGRGFRNAGDRGGGYGGFPPERGRKRGGSRSRHSPPPRMRRGRGGLKR